MLSSYRWGAIRDSLLSGVMIGILIGPFLALARPSAGHIVGLVTILWIGTVVGTGPGAVQLGGTTLSWRSRAIRGMVMTVIALAIFILSIVVHGRLAAAGGDGAQ